MSRIGMIVVVATMVAGSLFACGDKNAPLSPRATDAAADVGGTPGLDGGGVSFAVNIMPLLEKSCSCHVTGSIAPLLNNYANVKASAEVSSIAIQNGSMPISAPLSADDQALFLGWLSAGMPNN